MSFAPCTATCKACNLAAMEGDCSAIAADLDPGNECTGHCNGAGVCAGPTCVLETKPIFAKYCAPCHTIFNSGGTNFAANDADLAPASTS